MEESVVKESVKDNTTSSVSDEPSFVKEVLEKNLYYATQEDIDGYLSTISKKGHEETKQVMSEFFKEYDVEHTLEAFEIVEKNPDEIIAKAKQKTVSSQQSNNNDSYKNHVAEVLHIFIKENDEWKINESNITDINFIE